MSTSSVTSQDTAASLYAQLNSSSGSSSTRTSAEQASDRFLKLLVTQMQNQDPLNPMDNAQVTSQMAQINTVSGIEKVNESIGSMAGQFTQLQALQGVSLIGRGVLVQGNSLDVQDGKAGAAFDLDGPADAVKVEVLSAAGHVVDSIDMGAQGAGRHSFDWDATGVSAGAGLHFRVVATSGTAAVAATPIVRDQVDAVSTQNNQLQLELRNGGSVPYSQIKAFSS